MRALICMFALATACGAEVVCNVRADTWIDVPEFGRFRSAAAAAPGHGTDHRLVIRGRQALALLDFDLAAARGMTVKRAVLRLHREPDPVPLHTVGLSTISGSGPWSESGAGFRFAGEGQKPWSYAGSDIIDVTFAQGGSLYSYRRARDAGGGWYEVDVPPALVHALLSGDQYGLMLSDEKGQTQTRHVFGSREGKFPPALIVEGERSDRTAPARVQPLAAPDRARRIGTAMVRFGRAGDDAGAGVATRYELRYSERPITDFNAATPVPRWCLDALAPKPHAFATENALADEVTASIEGLRPGGQYYVAARAYDEAGNAGPVSQIGRYRAYARTFPELPSAAVMAPAASPAASPVWAVPELWKIDPRTGAVLEASEAPDHRRQNPVWDGATVRLQGARNEFVAFQLAVEQAAAGVEVKVARPLFSAGKLPPVFRAGAVQLYREWFVPDDKQTAEPRGWYPDALIPLAGPFDIPARDNAVPGQTVQPVWVDIYIPHDAAAGRHAGALLVTATGLRREVPIEIEVLPFALPDKLNFVVDLNCYGGVNAGYNMPRGTPEYRALEVAYHRLAHLHRANLDVLGYSHNGSVDPDHAPGLSGEGAATRVSDWTAWDAHFGPVLDGSAFRDLPRAGVPVPAIYLAFFENWPGDLRRSYRFNNYPVARTEEEYREILTRHALESAPVEESFSQEYQERFSAVAAQFAAHLKERKWTTTECMVYFNNKYYYKRPAQGGRGISWWLMDEPNHRDDVRAIGFLAYLLKRGTAKYPEVPIRLRTDVSRVEWIRDLLAGQIDLNCVSQHLFDKNRYMLDGRRRFGQRYWHYSTTNHPRDSNVAMRAWCWRVWLNGGEGIVPWNTVRGAEAWDRAEQLTVFYVGRKFGKNEPVASMRLKAFRRGQQDIEYLALLAKQKGWDREAVTHALAGAVDFSGAFRQASEEDAGNMRLTAAKDSQMEAARRRVARAIR